MKGAILKLSFVAFLVYRLQFDGADCQAQIVSKSPTWKEVAALIGAKTSSDDFRMFVTHHGLTGPKVPSVGLGELPLTLRFSNGGSISVFVKNDSVVGVTISHGEGVQLSLCLPHTVDGPLNKQSILPTLRDCGYSGLSQARPDDDEYSECFDLNLKYAIKFHNDDLVAIDFTSKELLAQASYSAKRFLSWREVLGDGFFGLLYAYDEGFAYRAMKSRFDTRNKSFCKLSHEDIELLHRLTTDLKPPNSVPRNPVLTLSFWKDNIWISYTYDKDQIPDSLRSIEQILQQGSPLPWEQ